MGRKKQQVISHFFAPTPKTTDGSPGGPSSTQGSSSPSPSSRKVSAIVSFSTSKRRLLSGRLNSAAKKQKLTPHTQNPVPSLHQKFINKLIEPCLDIAETSQNQCSKPEKYTPLEQQVAELKNRYPGIVLMIEVGYKFRFFGEDAEIASRVLGIFSYMNHNFLTASIPTVRLNVHVRRLVCAGYKVGVVKQTETASIKAHGENKTGPFCRGLSALYTKATLEAAQDMYGRDEGCAGESNYLCCVVENSVLTENANGADVRIGFVAVEISTGEVIYDEFNDDFMRSALDAIILNLAPSELLLGDPLSKSTEKLLLAYAGPASNVRIEHVSRDCFKDGGAVAEVASIYENLPEVEHQGSYAMLIEGILKMPDLAVQALALIACYLIQFGFERILCLTSSFQPYSSSLEMSLSANTLQQLEILKNNSDGSELGSLMHVMNHTLTMYGSRLLRHWVTHPLCDRNTICARLDAVSEITESIGSDRPYGSAGGLDVGNSLVTELEPSFYYLLTDVLANLGRSPDIQRGITRIFHRTATASEFIGVMSAVLYAGRQLQQLQIDEVNYYETGQAIAKKSLRSVLLKKLVLASSSPHVISIAAKLLSALCKEAAEQGDLPNLMIISNGQFPEAIIHDLIHRLGNLGKQFNRQKRSWIV